MMGMRFPGDVTRAHSDSPQVGERVAIEWIPSQAEFDAGDDGPRFDLVTVAARDEYTMTVRVGWIGSMPMLALVNGHTRVAVLGKDIDTVGRYADGAIAADRLYPLIRESETVALNYRR